MGVRDADIHLGGRSGRTLERGHFRGGTQARSTGLYGRDGVHEGTRRRRWRCDGETHGYAFPPRWWREGGPEAIERCERRGEIAQEARGHLRRSPEGQRGL